MILNNRVYDILKWVVQLVLPALSALWFGLGTVWGFPYLDQVTGTIVAVTVCLGVMLGISDSQWNLEKKLADSMGHSEYNADDDIFSEPSKSASPLEFSPMVYNLLKWITLFGLPAVGALYFTLSQLWGFPFGSEIVASLASLAAFLGALIGVSSKIRSK